jgi:hypothetical protein
MAVKDYRFDFAHWSQLFPPDRVEGLETIDFVNYATGPFETVLIERLRATAREQFDFGPPVPVDLFVFAQGEPRDRYITKVGGLPYRPAGKPWPQIKPSAPDARFPSPEGPMTFLAQFCFADSMDLVGNVPGDVLLIFAEDDEFARPDALTFEWYDLGLEDLINPQDVPPPRWTFVNCHGYRYRTADYPAGAGLVDRDGFCGQHMAFLGGTKIGGVASFIHGEEDEPYRAHLKECRFLGTLSAICPWPKKEWPWIDRQEPYQKIPQNAELEMVDAGCANFFVDPAGQVQWEFETY